MLLPLLLIAPQTDTLGETLVTAMRSPVSATTTLPEVTVVSGEELAATGESSLPRALASAAGVWVQESNLGGGAPVIRGLLGNQILIVVDGVRMNDSTTRLGPNQSLNTIDPAIVELVEIYRGTASVRYGSDAIGGVIVIWTKSRTPGGPENAHARELHGGVALRYDSAVDGGSGSVGLSGVGENFGWLGIGSAWEYDDLEIADGEVVPFTGYHGNAAFGSWEQALGSDRTLRVTAMSHRDFDVPRTFILVPGFGQDEATHQVYDFKLQDRRRYQLMYDDRLDGGFADQIQLRLSFGEYTEQQERQRTGSSNFVFEQYQVDTAGVGGDWRKELAAGNLLTFGFDFDHDDVDSFGRETDLSTGDVTLTNGAFAPNARYDAFGAFVTDEITSMDPWAFTLGLRYSLFDFAFDDPDTGERLSSDFDAITASAAVARDLSASTRISATLSQGFQAPNLEDLANDGAFAGGTELANPDLQPAESLGAEIALEVLKERWQGGVAVFGTHIDDVFGRHLLDEGDPDFTGDETYLRSNAGELLLYGAEAMGEYTLFRPDSPWSVEGAIAWVRGRQHDDTIDPNTGEAPLDGVEARRIPPINGHLGLAWTERDAARWLDRAALIWRWACEQDHLHPEDQSDPRIDPEGTEGWNTFDIDLGGPITKGVRWTVTFANVFDAAYRVHGSGIDAPGRSVLAGLDAGF